MIQITRDGQLVRRRGYSTIATSGTKIPDNEVSESYLERAKAGKAPNARWFDTEDADSVPAVDGTPEAVAPQNEQALNPGNDGDFEDLTRRANEAVTERNEARDRVEELESEVAELRAEIDRLKSGGAESQDASIGAPPASGSGGAAEVPDSPFAETYDDDPDYDPNAHNQADVLEYLKGASPGEVERIKELEAKSQNRQQIAAFKVAE